MRFWGFPQAGPPDGGISDAATESLPLPGPAVASSAAFGRSQSAPTSIQSALLQETLRLKSTPRSSEHAAVGPGVKPRVEAGRVALKDKGQNYDMPQVHPVSLAFLPRMPMDCQGSWVMWQCELIRSRVAADFLPPLTVELGYFELAFKGQVRVFLKRKACAECTKFAPICCMFM